MSKKSAILVIFQIISMVFLLVYNNPIATRIGLILQLAGALLGLWGILSIKIEILIFSQKLNLNL